MILDISVVLGYICYKALESVHSRRFRRPCCGADIDQVHNSNYRATVVPFLRLGINIICLIFPSAGNVAVCNP